MKAGDHIYIYLRYKGVKYSHHGIYIGDNRVIHYCQGKIRRSKLYKKSKWYGRTIHIRKHESSYSSKRVIKRAKKRLDENKYDPLFNNCEHFAYWCKTGERRSKHVEEAPLNAFKAAQKTFKRKMEEAYQVAKNKISSMKRKFKSIKIPKFKHLKI